MDLRILNNKEEGKKLIYLSLAIVDMGISVVACDKKGKFYMNDYLVCFGTKGTMSRYFNVNTSLGFDLDKEGRIELDNK